MVLLLDKEHSCVGVGAILLLDDDTTRKYRNIYLNQVATSLLTDHNKGRKPLLTAERSKTLGIHICGDTYMGSKGIVHWIEKQFIIPYSVTAINALLTKTWSCL